MQRHQSANTLNGLDNTSTVINLFVILQTMENQLNQLESCVTALTSAFETIYAENKSLAAEVKRLNEENIALTKNHEETVNTLKSTHLTEVETLQKNSSALLVNLEDKNELLRTTLLDSADAIKALLMRLPKVIQEEIEK